MASIWIEDDDAKSFLKQVKNLRDDVSIAKEEMSLRLQDAAIENPQLFVKLVDEMISTYESKNTSHRELPLAERMAQSSKKYKKLPAKLRRRRNSSKKSMGRTRDTSDAASLGSLPRYDSHDTISYTISDDEASHTSKSVLSIDADADAVEIEFALDENASQSSNVSYASRVAKMIRKMRKRFSNKESVSSELTEDFDEFDMMKNHNTRMVGTVQSHESGLKNTMSDPLDAKMARTSQIRHQPTFHSRFASTKAKVAGKNRDGKIEMESKSFPPLQPEKTSISKGKVSMFRRIFKTRKKTSEAKTEDPKEETRISRVPVLITPTDASVPSRRSPSVPGTNLQQGLPKSHLQQASMNHSLPENGKGQSPIANSVNMQVSPPISKQPPIQKTSRLDSEGSLLVASSSTAAKKGNVRERFGITGSSSSDKTQPCIPDIVRSYDGEEENQDKAIADLIGGKSDETAHFQTNHERNSKNHTKQKVKPDPPTIDEKAPHSDSQVLGEKKTHENQKVPLLGETKEHGNRKMRQDHLDQFGLQIYSPKRSYSPEDLNLLAYKTKDPAPSDQHDHEKTVAKKKYSAREPQDLKKHVSRKADTPQNPANKPATKKKWDVEERKNGGGAEHMRKNRSKMKKAVRVQSPRRKSHRSGLDDDKSMSSLSFLTNFLDDLDDSLNDAIDRNEAIKTLFDSYDKMIASRKRAKKKSRDDYKRNRDRSRRGSLHQTSSQEFSIGSAASFDMLDPF